MGNSRKKKPEKRKPSRTFISSFVSSILSSQSFISNTDARWCLELLNPTSQYLAIVKIIYCLAQSNVNKCFEGNRGKRRNRTRQLEVK